MVIEIGLNDRIKKSSFKCEMCKKYYMNSFSYEWGTFEGVPHNPTIKLIICGKCVVRESRIKNIASLKEYYE